MNTLTKHELCRIIEVAFDTLIARYEEKDSLIQAEETHGEELDGEFIAARLEILRDTRDSINAALDDLSYIE